MLRSILLLPALAAFLTLCLQADQTLAYTGATGGANSGGGGGGHTPTHTHTHTHTHDAASSTTGRRGGATGMPGWIQGLKPVMRVGVCVCECGCICMTFDLFFFYIP
jgi:hypothetical protein